MPADPQDTPASDPLLPESGRTGRILYARVRPNEDLVHTIEKLCLQHGFSDAVVRGSLGSLSQCCLETHTGARIEVPGPAVEMLTLMGEVRSTGGALEARLSGTVADPQGRIFAGRFAAGRNPVCITFEITLEEWLADARAA
ncbi:MULTISPECIES: PPC domain-containing DNA-binding protein [Azorhizobium]|uniref:PPC domain-containing DNA-binding protein n=1 Tax=Azorhizobium TaxID=6 RepID=UPI00105D92FF|nr:PPC domain-containing DNA-binding protein [Azorhizobium sp. AG788]TDT91248.1 putative DNA-binding protein with PD1-like motif [Azorhizobium sp. AG788]